MGIVKLAITLLQVVIFSCSAASCKPAQEKVLRDPNITQPVVPVTAAAPEVLAAPEILAETPSRLTTGEVFASPSVSPLAPQPANTGTVVYLPTIINTPTPVTVSGGLIANNAVVDQFSSIPPTAINAAKAKKVLFYHQSTGGYIDAFGLECLAGARGGADGYPAECTTYAQNPDQYSRANWQTPFWPTPLADGPAKVDEFMGLMTSQVFSTYDIIGMKFCYVDGWNIDFNYYRTKMESLEAAHPNKVFIWATEALWNTPGSACDPSNPYNSCKNIADFNNQLRAYARANNKPLFDIASIESNNGACQVAGYEGMCSQYYADSGGHPNIIESIRLAKGFWWLIAKLSGWN